MTAGIRSAAVADGSRVRLNAGPWILRTAAGRILTAGGRIFWADNDATSQFAGSRG